MASERAASWLVATRSADGRFGGGWLALLACTALACGASGERYFPLQDPLWRDTDQHPVSIDCEKRSTDEEPDHVSCAPEPYVSPLAWDGADNSIFRPLARVFAVDPAGPAPNVNAFDEVPDSAWFQNRIGKRRPSREELLAGACTPNDLLDGETAPSGSWVIDQGKPNGASPGFRIRVADKFKFLLKTDSLDQPERPTAASAIGAAIYHAVGFNTSCEQIVYFHPTTLELQPGLIATDNSGVPRRFDAKALERVLRQAEKRGEFVRMQASAWLPGYLLGPFRYEGTRGDDPNDVIPHEDRRELRGARVLASWINHFDSREQNSMDSWIASDPKVKDGSPGYVRHYYLDTSDSFGSEWEWDEVSRRLGVSYLLDWGDIGYDFITLGTTVRPWERAQRNPGFELFGYFHYRDFDPDSWKNEYPNPAFSRATEHDNAWMARILSRFEPEDVELLVTLGKFSRPEHSAFLTEVLEQRLRRILARYLSRLSPLAEPRLEPQDELCMVDLARRRGVAPPDAFQYRARWLDGSGGRALDVEARPGGEVCARPPHASPDGAPPPADTSRYRVLAVANRFSRYIVKLHLYDLGPSQGFRLVGLERPELTLDEVEDD
jgi:hypothetical protein